MAALATLADVEARLGWTLSDPDEQTRVTALLGDASATVRTYTGQQFTKATTTDRLNSRGGKVVLPQRPVESVASVAGVNGNTLGHVWHAGTTVDVTLSVPDTWAWEPYRTQSGWVDVTYTHGYDAIPDDIIGVVSQMVIRSFSLAPGASGLTQESIGEYSYQIGSITASGPAGLMNDERSVLDRYRLVAGVVNIW